MSWSVAIVERELPVGPLDNWILGEDASHSFLRFRDEDGRIFCELHGMGENPVTKRVSGFPHGARAYFSLAAWWAGRNVGWGPRLRVVALTSHAEMDALGRGRPVTEHVFSGNADLIARAFETALRAAHCINQADLAYYAFSTKGNGQNCHSVMIELAERIGLDNKLPALAFGAPGVLTDLAQPVPALCDIKRHDDAEPHTVIGSILDHAKHLAFKLDHGFLGTVRRALEMPDGAEDTVSAFS